MKGLILAGGTGSRLFPTTMAVNKHLLPVYDKPMIYYSLAKLLLLGIKDIAIICRAVDVESFQAILDRIIKLGVNIEFLIQEAPNGLPEAFLIAEDFIGADEVVLILGDNILFGHQLHVELKKEINSQADAVVFAYRVSNPSSFGVVDIDVSGRIISIEEKPKHPKSNFALVGLYKFDSSVINFARELKPSVRGETEIVDLIKLYLQHKTLKVKIIGRGNTWLDTGTPKNLLNAAHFVETIESRQGYNIACLEEICLRCGFTSKEQLKAVMPASTKTSYDEYIMEILNDF